MIRQIKTAFFVMFLVLGASLAVAGESVPAQAKAKSTWDLVSELLEENRESDAFQLALKHKDEDDPRLICFLGSCYVKGKVVKQNTAEALRYFRRSENEVPLAKYYVGLFYALGENLQRDLDKGWSLMSEAIERGVRLTNKEEERLIQLLTNELSEYYDPELKLRFPGGDSGLKSISRYLPKSLLGYSLRYAYASGNAKLDLYVYNPTSTPVPDGVSDATQKEIENAAMAVKYFEKMGRYKNIREAKSRGNGKLKESGLEYSWQSFCYDPGEQKDLWSVILTFGARGKIIKLRYTSPIKTLLQGDEADINKLLDQEAFLPPMVTLILDRLDVELSKAQ